MALLGTLLATVLSAILYRAGGMGKDPSAKPTWIPMWMRHSKARDVGCSLVLIGLSMFLFGISDKWWFYVLCFAASWGSLSTYWDELFGYDNFYFHGFMCGLAGCFLIGCGIAWWIPVIRLVVCTLGMGLWSAKVSNDVKEEMGRGAFFIL